MKWPLFENKIRKSLHSHQSEVDADAIWAAIEPQVDVINRRKKRRFILFWFLFPMLLASGSAFYFSQADIIGKNKVEIPANAVVSVNNKERENPVFNPNNNAIKLLQGGESNGDKTGLSANIDNAIIAEQKQKNNTKTTQSTAFSNKTIRPLHTATKAIADQSANSTNPGPTGLEATIAEQTTKEQAIMAIAMPTETEMRMLEAVPYLPCETLATNGPKLPALQPMALELPMEMPALRKRDFRLTAAVLGGISFLDREMTADSAFFSLLDLRERTERELEAVQAGIRLGVEHRSGFGFSTGLNYAQLNEVYSNNSSVTNLDTVYDIQYFYINFENDTIPVYGDIELERRTTQRKEIYNKYRLIEVPLLASWRHEGHQFSFGAQAGAFVNLRMIAKGKVMKTTTEDVDISSGDIYRTNIGLSYYFGLTAGYILNDQLEVFAAPFMRHFPKSFTKSTYGLQQRYNLYGLNVGLAYRF